MIDTDSPHLNLSLVMPSEHPQLFYAFSSTHQTNGTAIDTDSPHLHLSLVMPSEHLSVILYFLLSSIHQTNGTVIDTDSPHLTDN